MLKAKHTNILLKYNILTGLISGAWVFLFLFLIKPFKQDRLSVFSSFKIAISMSLIIVLSYFLIIFIQNWVFKKNRKWELKSEMILMFIFLIINFIGIFLVYKSSIAKGSYSVLKFFYTNFLPSVFILLPEILILREYFFRCSHNKIKKPEFIFIYGENKLDFLKLKREDLVSISSAQNYVEVSFLVNNKVQTKLIRTTLKKIHLDLSFLKKVHRSHVINPIHFISFKDKKTLNLTQKEIPFSDTYKNNLVF